MVVALNKWTCGDCSYSFLVEVNKLDPKVCPSCAGKRLLKVDEISVRKDDAKHFTDGQWLDLKKIFKD